MGTNFLVILTLLFLQGFGLSNNMLMTSSNVTCIERERQSLLEIKHSLKDKYNLLSTWSGVECCVWQGVECDSRSGHVVKLDLRSQVYVEMITPIDKCLEGDLSPSLQNLKHLHYLDLSMNNFSGNIPEFFGSLKFQRLEYLNLSGSFSAGVVPHHLGNLSRLQYLDLSYYFVNTLMTLVYTRTPILDDLGWLSSLSSLRYLGLSGISIGEYHDWVHSLNKLPSLRTLNLGECGITNIPSVKFVNYTSLNSLDLSSNEISSTIPVWLSNLTGLMHLNLRANYFHGIIPDFIGCSAICLPSTSPLIPWKLLPDLLRNLSSLVHLDLSYNMVSCPIPQTVGLLLRLEDLNLRGNQLSGNIPTSLWQLSKLKNLDLSYNSLAGVLSESYFTKLKNLNNLGLSGNWLALNFSSGWIPPFQLQIFGASSCNIGPNFPNWLQTQTHLQSLVLSNSSIKDTIPEWFENIMSHIFELDLSNNQIRGKLPRLHFNNGDNIVDGVIWRMNSNKFEGSLATFPSNVRLLDLSDNLLSGHVPQTVGTINPRLLAVNISKNRFTGSIPVQLYIYIKPIKSNHLANQSSPSDLAEMKSQPLKLQKITAMVAVHDSFFT